MSEAGDLLELLHGAGDRWTTVAATIRIWRHNELEQRARQRFDRDRRGGSIHMFIAGGGAPPRGEHEETIRVWIAKPDRSRQEWAHGVSVTRGRTWANYHPLHGYMTNADQDDAGAGAPLSVFGQLLDPARLLSALSFDVPVATDAELLVRALSWPRRLSARSGTRAAAHRARAGRRGSSLPPTITKRTSCGA